MSDAIAVLLICLGVFIFLALFFSQRARHLERMKMIEKGLNPDNKLGRRHDHTPLHQALSDTERKVLQLISQHKTSREIASILFLSPYTIKNHRHSICRKLGLKDGNNVLLKWTIQHKELFE